MTPIESADKIVRDLQDELEALTGRTAILQKQREQLNYSARTGDKIAKAKLEKINDEIAFNSNELDIVTSALREAERRAGAAQQSAQQAETIAANAERQRQIAELQTAITERLEILDEACEDIATTSNEVKILFAGLHKLGVASPTDDQLRINSTMAFKTLLNRLPWPREFQFEFGPSVLAPNQRISFGDLAKAWGAAIGRHLVPADKKDAA